MIFRVGQKVVCVDDGQGAFPAPKMSGLAKGAVYTILAVECVRFPIDAVQVEEHHVEGCWFRAARFRPVKTTSIEIFRQMLVNPPREVVDA